MEQRVVRGGPRLLPGGLCWDLTIPCGSDWPWGVLNGSGAMEGVVSAAPDACRYSRCMNRQRAEGPAKSSEHVHGLLRRPMLPRDECLQKCSLNTF